jgi:mannan endo-1,6-alpha-mannosidase
MRRVSATACLLQLNIASVHVRALGLGDTGMIFFYRNAAAESFADGYTSTASIKASAKSIAAGLVQQYSNTASGSSVGLFSSDYSWWEDGAIWDGLVDYWSWTGDAQYNSIVQTAISSQAGANDNFFPASQLSTAGNSDQAIWAITAIGAVESSFPGSGDGRYLEMAISVFEQQVLRWDNYTCAGGLHSKISANAAGFTTKDSFSTGTFFQLAARLALHTQNSTYTQWATRAFDWAVTAGLINDQTWAVFDGTDSSTNCSSVSQTQWSINAGSFLYGSAVMYNLVCVTHDVCVIIPDMSYRLTNNHG